MSVDLFTLLYIDYNVLGELIMNFIKSALFTFIVVVICAFSLSAAAQSGHGYTPRQLERIQVRYERLQQRNTRGQCGVVCQQRLNRLGGILSAQSVPELDASTAPLAAFLLVGLLAAGIERRRKLSQS